MRLSILLIILVCLFFHSGLNFLCLGQNAKSTGSFIGIKLVQFILGKHLFMLCLLINFNSFRFIIVSWKSIRESQNSFVLIIIIFNVLSYVFKLVGYFWDLIPCCNNLREGKHVISSWFTNTITLFIISYFLSLVDLTVQLEVVKIIYLLWILSKLWFEPNKLFIL